MKANLLVTISRSAACVVAALGMSLVPGAATSAVILDPFLAGQFAEGTGANATFVDITDTWHDSQGYWREPRGRSEKGKYSDEYREGYERIGSLEWGDGIWGLPDWRTLSALSAGDPLVEGFWSGRVATIDQGDVEYQRCLSEAPSVGAEPTCLKWGVVGNLPAGFFAPASAQDNWTSHYTGYLRIDNPGEYNFGVMYDDGFFLRIRGAGGETYEISSDFLSPRDRLGFDEDFLLSRGLYQFELGAYDRLEVGVVNLAWSVNNGRWTTVPTEHLVTDPIAIPTPGTPALLLAAIGALALVRRKRKRG